MSQDYVCDCGSWTCKGECRLCYRCHQEGCGCPPEAPGARLERLAAAERRKLQEGMQKAVVDRLLPSPPKKERTLEDFEAELAKRPKVQIAKRANGTTYRTRVK